jgi:methyl-accepting chemotaxis protein
MNELGDLADGDLTVTATVSENITGAIADSINYTIEELRVLVGRINDAANRVTAATEIARQNSTSCSMPPSVNRAKFRKLASRPSNGTFDE